LAVTNPEVLTVATVVLLDVHVTLFLVAFDGLTVAVNSFLSPSARVTDVGDTLTPVTLITAAETWTKQRAILDPSLVVTVIVAVPAFTALTFPLLSTVAFDGVSDSQVTSLFVASEGLKVTINFSLSPSDK
jgi:hypothetical protein